MMNFIGIFLLNFLLLANTITTMALETIPQTPKKLCRTRTTLIFHSNFSSALVLDESSVLISLWMLRSCVLVSIAPDNAWHDDHQVDIMVLRHACKTHGSTGFCAQTSCRPKANPRTSERQAFHAVLQLPNPGRIHTGGWWGAPGAAVEAGGGQQQKVGGGTKTLYIQAASMEGSRWNRTIPIVKPVAILDPLLREVKFLSVSWFMDSPFCVMRLEILKALEKGRTEDVTEAFICPAALESGLTPPPNPHQVRPRAYAHQGQSPLKMGIIMWKAK